MDWMPFSLIFFHTVCFVAMGVLIGIQFVHLIEYESKKIVNYSQFDTIQTAVSLIFIVFVLAESDGFEKSSHWIIDLLQITCVFVSVYMTIKFLFRKKGISFSDTITE